MKALFAAEPERRTRYEKDFLSPGNSCGNRLLLVLDYDWLLLVIVMINLPLLDY